MSDQLSDVDYVAQKIKHFFADEKRLQFGKPYRPSPKFNKPEFWRAAADICIELQADPYSFVRSAFLYCQVPGGPFPHLLCGNAVRRWYADYQKLNSAQVGENVYEREVQSLIVANYQRAMLYSRVHEKTVKEIILSDFWMPPWQTPAYIRLLLKGTDPDVKRVWGRIGYAELVGNPNLLKCLQDKQYDLSFMDEIAREIRGI